MHDKLKLLVGVAAFGGMGAVFRMLLSEFFAARSAAYPAGTLIVNLLGCLAIGLVMGMADRLPSFWVSLITIGFLGGFTTFSAFSFEGVQLVQQGRFGAAAFYIGTSLGLGGLMTFIGLWAARIL